MVRVTAVETSTAFVFTATDGTAGNSYLYEWGKRPPEGQTKTQYLQSCKREAQLLAEDEIVRKQPPTELAL